MIYWHVFEWGAQHYLLEACGDGPTQHKTIKRDSSRFVLMLNLARMNKRIN